MANDRTDLMQGTLELLILKTLSHESMHGYGIAQRIQQSVDDLLTLPGTLSHGRTRLARV
jgi:DNA-binding PadR family transcriptional regulator